MYDSNNIFAKIIRKEIPCNMICENDFFLSFHDVAPNAPVHALVIPKGNFINAHDFCLKASEVAIAQFWKGVAKTIELLKLSEQGGYRIISNSGINAHQSIEHFHVHILGGKDLGSLIVCK